MAKKIDLRAGGCLEWHTTKKAPEGELVLTAYIFEDKNGVQTSICLREDKAATRFERDFRKTYKIKVSYDRFGFDKYKNTETGTIKRVLAWARIPAETRELLGIK